MKAQKLYSFIGKYSDFYDILASLLGYKKSVAYFLKHLPFAKDSTFGVLDAGCGSGVYTLELLRKYPNVTVTAFDKDLDLVNYTALKAIRLGYSHRITTFTADIISDLQQLKNRKFDLIITAGVLVYVPHREAIKNLSLFLVPGGYFFNSPNRDSIWGKLICLLYACKPYPSRENIAAFEENGFKLVKNIPVPKTPASSFKDAHLFRKI